MPGDVIALTAIGSTLGPERVNVKVAAFAPEFPSVTLTSLILIVGPSSSVMKHVPRFEPTVAFWTFEISRKNVSCASSTVSPLARKCYYLLF